MLKITWVNFPWGGKRETCTDKDICSSINHGPLFHRSVCLSYFFQVCVPTSMLAFHMQSYHLFFFLVTLPSFFFFPPEYSQHGFLYWVMYSQYWLIDEPRQGCCRHPRPILNVTHTVTCLPDQPSTPLLPGAVMQVGPDARRYLPTDREKPSHPASEQPLEMPGSCYPHLVELGR